MRVTCVLYITLKQMIAIEQTCHGGEKVVKDTLINMLTVVPAKAVFDLFGIDMAVFAPKK